MEAAAIKEEQRCNEEMRLAPQPQSPGSHESDDPQPHATKYAPSGSNGSGGPLGSGSHLSEEMAAGWGGGGGIQGFQSNHLDVSALDERCAGLAHKHAMPYIDLDFMGYKGGRDVLQAPLQSVYQESSGSRLSVQQQQRAQVWGGHLLGR